MVSFQDHYGPFKTIHDGSSKKDTFQDHFTSFKTIVNRVNNLNPQYMVPADEATLVISDPKSMKKTQEVAEQPSSGPPPPGSQFKPHLHGAWISDHRQYQGPPGSVPQQLQLHRWHARWVRHQDRPYSPASPAQQDGRCPSSTRRRLRRS